MRILGKLKRLAGFFLPLALLTLGSNAHALTGIWMDSDANDYIGQGQSYTFPETSGNFSVTTGISGISNAVSLTFETPDTANEWQHVTLEFAPPAGKTLSVGSYEGAERLAFATPGHPGMDISMTGRGCNEISGRFDVLELGLNNLGQLNRLAIDFEQHCDNAPPLLFGQLRFNSDISAPPPVDNSRVETKRAIAIALLEAKAFDQQTHDNLLSEINAATSIGELHAIMVRMRASNIPVEDPRLAAKRSIALDLLEAKAFDQHTHDDLLAEINATTSVSDLHDIIVRMRASNNPVEDPRLATKRSIALDLLEAKVFDQQTHDDLLAEINTTTSISDLHDIILILRATETELFIGPRSSNPYYLVRANNLVFFVAETIQQGNELWASNGSETWLVKDISTGSESSHIEYLTAIGNVIYFSAHDGIHGKELWKSDGTESGTVLVKDIQQLTNGSNPWQLSASGDTLYFTADDGITGGELWKSDGTEAGTTLVKDIFPGDSSSQLLELTAVGNVVFFTANDGVHGEELWKSDGSEHGTVLVKDLKPGGADSDSFAGYLLDVNGTLYFAVHTEEYGTELWKSDGSDTGTVIVKDIYPGNTGSIPVFLTKLNDKVFFGATDQSHGRQLWQSDGTSGGTSLVRNIGDGAPYELTVIGDTLYFLVTSDFTQTLWKTDSTVAGTTEVMSGEFSHPGAIIDDLTAVQNTLYIMVYSSLTGYELWKADESTNTATKLRQFGPHDGYGNEYVEFGDKLIFSVNDPETGRELWISDGMTEGTVILENIQSE